MNSLTWHCVLVSSILALAAGAAGNPAPPLADVRPLPGRDLEMKLESLWFTGIGSLVLEAIDGTATTLVIRECGVRAVPGNHTVTCGPLRGSVPGDQRSG